MKIITTFLNLFIILFMGAMTSTAFAAECKLCDASSDGNIAEVNRLLAAKANPNVANAFGWTPLIYASIKGHAKIAKVLLTAGANPNPANNDGWTALMYAVNRASVEVRAEIAKMLLTAEANPNAVNNDGWTALMYAVREGAIRSVHLLVEHGADVEVAIPKKSQTPLMYASSKGYAEIAKVLLAKANPDLANEFGWTALMHAAKAGSANVTRALIKNGADVNIANGDGWTALDIAEEVGDRGVARLLRKAGAE